MQATANKTLKATEIAQVKYGVNILQCSWPVVAWAISEVEKVCGVKEAAKQMKAVNRKRESLGKYTDIPAFGTELFQAYFAK